MTSPLWNLLETVPKSKTIPLNNCWPLQRSPHSWTLSSLSLLSCVAGFVTNTNYTGHSRSLLIFTLQPDKSETSTKYLRHISSRVNLLCNSSPHTPETTTDPPPQRNTSSHIYKRVNPLCNSSPNTPDTTTDPSPQRNTSSHSSARVNLLSNSPKHLSSFYSPVDSALVPNAAW